MARHAREGDKSRRRTGKLWPSLSYISRPLPHQISSWCRMLSSVPHDAMYSGGYTRLAGIRGQTALHEYSVYTNSHDEVADGATAVTTEHERNDARGVQAKTSSMPAGQYTQ
jgi:hypothetical protein